MTLIKLNSKFVLLFLFIVVIAFLSFYTNEITTPKQYYYYAFSDKIEIKQVPEKITIKKENTITRSTIESTIKRLFGDVSFDWQNEDISKVEIKNLKDKYEKINTLLADNEIVSVRDVYKTNDNLEFSFIDEIVVKFKYDVNTSIKENLIKEFNLKRTKITKIYEVFSVSKFVDILETANKLYESGYFEFAYPNIICRAELFSFPNDPYFQYQVTCHNTGQTFNGHTGTSDADIDAPEAWDITTGCSDVVIAVFDSGLTSDHPDLPNTRQVRLDGSNFGSGDEDDPSPSGDEAHGNACAGVIAATMNNNQGIAGIAPNSRIMPIRWDGTTIPAEMVDGIEFAVDNGAVIISNSWGYNTDNNNFIPAIVTAIQYAVNNNVVVIFAAGNTARHYSCDDDGYVTFPANANVNSLLTVGASDRYDNQADYSPTNSLIDIVAPSHKAYPPGAYYPLCGGISGETFEMWTIDIPDGDGYNSWPASGTHPPSTGEVLPNTGTNYLSYTGRFGGTSHSCPVVAGVAALILSLNPDLTPQEVFNILTSSADKVGSYTYTNGRCDEMGYGRVNAYQAVLLAAGGPITGNPLVCQSPNITFTYNDRPDGTTIYWTKSSNLDYVSGQNTDYYTVRAHAYASGPGWVHASLNSGCAGLTYSVWVGGPQVEVTGPSEGYVGNTYTYYANTVPQATSYQWTLSPPYDGNNIYNYGYWADAAFNAPQEGYFQIGCTAHNTCGDGIGTTYIYIYNGGYGYSISPNPASNEITVTVIITDSNKKFDYSNTDYEVAIYNIYGVLQSQKKYSGESFTIPVYNLRDGTYILKIDNGKFVVNKQLIVKH
jgi:subtilisin family serine protease